MSSIQNQDYKGCAIVAMTTPAPSGKYHSLFSVHSAKRSEFTNQFALVYQDRRIQGRGFETEADAIDDAHERAKAWIDAQPD